MSDDTSMLCAVYTQSDGKGTLDAVTASIGAYHSDIIRAEVVGAGCGPITMGDIERAKAAGEGIAGQACTILAFNVGYASADISESARRDGLEVKKQSVIYSLLDDVKEVLQVCLVYTSSRLPSILMTIKFHLYLYTYTYRQECPWKGSRHR